MSLRAIATAIFDACAARCADFEWVYVPIDGSSLALQDPHKTRGTGPVGALAKAARGFLVMTAIAVSPTGVALGVCGQHFWRRAERRIKDSRAKRPFARRESRFWLVVARQVIAAFARAAPNCRPWFQLDRGGDVGEVLLAAVANSWRITVRAGQNRRLAHDSQVRYLWQELGRRPVLGRYTFEVAATATRAGRSATMSVRACTVTMQIKDGWSKKVQSVTVGAVLAREVYAPAGEPRLEWLLLTTAPMTTFAEARAVIDGYAVNPRRSMG